MNLPIISLILEALAGAAQLTDVFGRKGERLAPVLATVARFARLPAETQAEQEALLAQVKQWVAEKRGPTDAELDALTARREQLDTALRAIYGQLTGGAP